MPDIDLEQLARLSDSQATRRLYERFTPNPCTCAYCRNFRAQSDLVTEPTRLLLRRMGIDPEKPVEIVDYGKGAAGGRTYQVEWAFLPGGHAQLDKPAKVSFDGREITLYSGGIPCAHFDAAPHRCSISALIPAAPWVLDETEPVS